MKKGTWNSKYRVSLKPPLALKTIGNGGAFAHI
jgi:hypothetical protein